MLKSIFLLMSMLMLTNLQATELYRSIDKDGKVHYGDSPLEGTEDVEKLKSGNESGSDENLPYETKRAMQNFPVTLYTFPKCGSACQQARELLSKRGVPITEKSLSTQDEISTFVKESGDSKMPAMLIGKTWMKGFLAEQWNNELDFAGYPKKVLTYRPPAAATPPAQPADQ